MKIKWLRIECGCGGAGEIRERTRTLHNYFRSYVRTRLGGLGLPLLPLSSPLLFSSLHCFLPPIVWPANYDALRRLHHKVHVVSALQCTANHHLQYGVRLAYQRHQYASIRYLAAPTTRRRIHTGKPPNRVPAQTDTGAPAGTHRVRRSGVVVLTCRRRISEHGVHNTRGSTYLLVSASA